MTRRASALPCDCPAFTLQAAIAHGRQHAPRTAFHVAAGSGVLAAYQTELGVAAAVALIALFVFITKRMTFGRRIYAIGGQANGRFTIDDLAASAHLVKRILHQGVDEPPAAGKN